MLGFILYTYYLPLIYTLKLTLMKTRKRLKIYRDVIYMLSALIFLGAFLLALSIEDASTQKFGVLNCVLLTTVGVLFCYKQQQINKQL